MYLRNRIKKVYDIAFFTWQPLNYLCEIPVMKVYSALTIAAMGSSS